MLLNGSSKDLLFAHALFLGLVTLFPGLGVLLPALVLALELFLRLVFVVIFVGVVGGLFH